MISGTQDISLSSPWDSRHQQHFTTSHHHSSVPQLHGTQTPATLHNFTPPLISPSSPWDSDTSNTPQLHTTTHQSFVSMGFKHQQHITSSHRHSSVHHLHGTHGTHKFTQPLISPPSPWDSQVHATTISPSSPRDLDTSNTSQVHTSTHTQHNNSRLLECVSVSHNYLGPFSPANISRLSWNRLGVGHCEYTWPLQDGCKAHSALLQPE